MKVYCTKVVVTMSHISSDKIVYYIIIIIFYNSPSNNNFYSIYILIFLLYLAFLLSYNLKNINVIPNKWIVMFKKLWNNYF